MKTIISVMLIIVAYTVSACAGGDEKSMAIQTAQEYLKAIYEGNWKQYERCAKADDPEILQMSFEGQLLHMRFQKMLRNRYGDNAIAEFNELIGKLYQPERGRLQPTTYYLPDAPDEVLKKCRVDEYNGKYVVQPLMCGPIVVNIQGQAAQVEVGSGFGSRFDKEKIFQPAMAMWKKGIELLTGDKTISLEQMAREAGKLGTTWTKSVDKNPRGQ